MKMFIVLSESHLKVGQTVVYRFLISFLDPGLLRFKDLKNGTKNAQSLIKSIKTDKTCDVI